MRAYTFAVFFQLLRIALARLAIERLVGFGWFLWPSVPFIFITGKGRDMAILLAEGVAVCCARRQAHAARMQADTAARQAASAAIARKDADTRMGHMQPVCNLPFLSFLTVLFFFVSFCKERRKSSTADWCAL